MTTLLIKMDIRVITKWSISNWFKNSNSKINSNYIIFIILIYRVDERGTMMLTKVKR